MLGAIPDKTEVYLEQTNFSYYLPVVFTDVIAPSKLTLLERRKTVEKNTPDSSGTGKTRASVSRRQFLGAAAAVASSVGLNGPALEGEDTGGLLKSIKLTLSNFHRDKVKQIDDFDYRPVAKKVNRDLNGVPQTYLDQGIENLKRYYVVALLDPANRHAVSRQVDPFWHAHVLFTRPYSDFCQHLYGHYIHHTPLDPDDQKMVAHVTKLYNYTLEIYQKIFTSVDPNWWPDLSLGSFGPICYHNRVNDKEILDKGLFSVRPELMRGVPKDEG